MGKEVREKGEEGGMRYGRVREKEWQGRGGGRGGEVG